MSVVEVRNLRKEFGDVVAVNDIDLDIKEGEFFTLLGPSGSGKTTILRTIAGLELPTSGTIRFSGEEITNDPPYTRDVNTVFQDYALFPHMTVRENISYGLEIRGTDDEKINQRVEDLLDLVSLPGMGDRNVSDLSGGQQQRIALARALAIEPEMLLLDEPLGALDEKLRREMQIELKEIQEQLGTTFLYVTHDQEEALSMSDRMAVMDDGDIIQTGLPDEIYERPRTRFIAEFFRGSNIFTAAVSETTESELILSFHNNEIKAEPTDKIEITEGETTSFFVRSEQIDTTTKTNTVTGTITNTIYRGSETDYTVSTDDFELTVTLRDGEYTEGDQITVGWKPEDTILLYD